jgi:hypothetical protein
VLAWFDVPVAAADPAPGALISKADVVRLVGRDLAGPKSMPVGIDDDLGARQSVSVHGGGELRVLVAVFTFPSARDAAAKMTKSKIAELIDEENPKTVTVAEESGVGDRGFWSTCKSGVGFTVVKGTQVLAIAIAIAGELSKLAASYHDNLKSIAAAAAAKL